MVNFKQVAVCVLFAFAAFVLIVTLSMWRVDIGDNYIIKLGRAPDPKYRYFIDCWLRPFVLGILDQIYGFDVLAYVEKKVESQFNMPQWRHVVWAERNRGKYRHRWDLALLRICLYLTLGFAMKAGVIGLLPLSEEIDLDEEEPNQVVEEPFRAEEVGLESISPIETTTVKPKIRATAMPEVTSKPQKKEGKARQRRLVDEAFFFREDMEEIMRKKAFEKIKKDRAGNEK